jgi:polar amino acid transport system substrate-binding protein
VAGQSIVVRAAESAVRGAGDLAGRRIGCQLGTTGEMEAKKVAEARVVSFDAIGAAFRDLENGNLDAVIADTPTARIFIRDHATLVLVGEPLTREEFGMAARLKDGDLVAAIDRTLEQLRAEGTLRSIEERWGIAPGGP